jgi:putative transposase
MQLVQQEKQNGSGLKVSAMCQSLSLSRATYYRGIGTENLKEKELFLRDKIQRIALKYSAYGYRRIGRELKGRGYIVNHKRVLRLMRQDNLLCLRRKKFFTSGRSSDLVFSNLTKGLELNDINQLWVADITYIRLEREFIYLAVILDAFSRRCIGWAVDRHYETELALNALQMALGCRRASPDLIHHSDRGAQYTSREYTDLLKQYGIKISMSRPGNPYDNAQAESFMKTLKYEEVLLSEYRNLQDARFRIGEFLEKVYNRKRLHSALDYKSPVEFEKELKNKKYFIKRCEDVTP